VSDVWPSELRVKDHGMKLAVTFESGEAFELSAEYLRVESPSAEVKGHGPGQEQLVYGKRQVAITKAEPIGTYAVRLIFSDGHSTGLFTWNYLAKLGRDFKTIWPAYEAKLISEKRSRG
jgi:DUF971 family protein